MQKISASILVSLCFFSASGFAVTKISGIQTTSQSMIAFWVDHKYHDCPKMKKSIENLPLMKSNTKQSKEIKTNLTRLSTSPACMAEDKQVCFYKVDQLIGVDLSEQARTFGCAGSVEKIEPPFEAAYICMWDDNKPGMRPQTFNDNRLWCEQSVKCPEEFSLFGIPHEKGEYRFLCAAKEDHSCPSSFSACEVQQLKQIKFGGRSKFELSGAADRVPMAIPIPTPPRMPAAAH